ncbi:hypothetical protein QYM36_010302, partial [Artemia franciscana]
KKVSLKPLEQPNILPGITASILSKCHCMKISALSLVLYIDTMSVDSIGWERLRHHVGNIPGGHVFYNVYVDRKLSCEGGQISLNTSSYKKKVSLKPLEQPNILPGITASILSKCHCMKISALSLVLYIDTMSVDSIGWERLRHHVGNIPGGHVFYNVYVDRKLSCEGGQMFM